MELEEVFPPPMVSHWSHKVAGLRSRGLKAEAGRRGSAGLTYSETEKQHGPLGAGAVVLGGAEEPVS